MSVNTEEILVEVAYALPNQQVIIPVKLSAGATAETAIQQCGVLAKFPEINLAENKIGIFGKLTQLDTPLRATKTAWKSIAPWLLTRKKCVANAPKPAK